MHQTLTPCTRRWVNFTSPSLPALVPGTGSGRELPAWGCHPGGPPAFCGRCQAVRQANRTDCRYCVLALDSHPSNQAAGVPFHCQRVASLLPLCVVFVGIVSRASPAAFAASVRSGCGLVFAGVGIGFYAAHTVCPAPPHRARRRLDGWRRSSKAWPGRLALHCLASDHPHCVTVHRKPCGNSGNSGNSPWKPAPNKGLRVTACFGGSGSRWQQR
jgi:hypothetical protein